MNTAIVHLNGAELAMRRTCLPNFTASIERMAKRTARARKLITSVFQIGYSKALRNEVVDALHLDANYIRRSDAEMNWRVG